MVTKTMVDKKLHIRLENGTVSGKTALKNVNLTNVKLDASDEDMYEAAKAYSTLSALPLDSIRLTDLYDVTSDTE